jgi:hypothetical protein
MDLPDGEAAIEEGGTLADKPDSYRLSRSAERVRQASRLPAGDEAMLTTSSNIDRHGSTRDMRRVTGLVCGIILMLMLGGGVSARQLPTDSSETRAADQRIDYRMLLMLKLRTNKGFEVAVYG